MAREKRDTRVLNIKLDRKVYEQLESFCDASGTTKTTATEKILFQFFSEYFHRPEEERKFFK